MPLRKRSYTADLLTQQQGEVLKVGYLRKKGHVRRNWLDRWFVLTTEGMYYYKNRTVSYCSMRSSVISSHYFMEWNRILGKHGRAVYVLAAVPELYKLHIIG